MKKGQSHHWTYKGHWHERKVAPGTWKGTFTATKRQRPRAGVGRGSKYRWHIKGTQTAVKTKSGTYQTKYKFTKRLIKAKPRKRRR